MVIYQVSHDRGPHSDVLGAYVLQYFRTKAEALVAFKAAVTNGEVDVILSKITVTDKRSIIELLTDITHTYPAFDQPAYSVEIVKAHRLEGADHLSCQGAPSVCPPGSYCGIHFPCGSCDRGSSI
tara:strand:- start:636 stop:1010 length:375 start_codon:yes stop_codon:yes gene_type:complete